MVRPLTGVVLMQRRTHGYETASVDVNHDLLNTGYRHGRLSLKGEAEATSGVSVLRDGGLKNSGLEIYIQADAA